MTDDARVEKRYIQNLKNEKSLSFASSAPHSASSSVFLLLLVFFFFGSSLVLFPHKEQN